MYLYSFMSDNSGRWTSVRTKSWVNIFKFDCVRALRMPKSATFHCFPDISYVFPPEIGKTYRFLCSIPIHREWLNICLLWPTLSTHWWPAGYIKVSRFKRLIYCRNGKTLHFRRWTQQFRRTETGWRSPSFQRWIESAEAQRSAS